jgi:hypothetical protein
MKLKLLARRPKLNPAFKRFQSLPRLDLNRIAALNKGARPAPPRIELQGPALAGFQLLMPQAGVPSTAGTPMLPCAA